MKNTVPGGVAFAIGTHPDDIEFMMSGTLFLLKEAGWTIHTMNLADGRCGSLHLSPEETAELRQKEARSAAGYLESIHHPPLARDLEIFYGDGLIRKLASVIRKVDPDILLLPSLEDYMEDHMNTARIAVTAAFARGMRNYATDPEQSPVTRDIALYHALPHGLKDAMGRRVRARIHVDISTVMGLKKRMLSCHESQKTWLDESQGMDSYVETMVLMAREVGLMSGSFTYAEGWRPHNHLGFCPSGFDPLTEALSGSLAMRSQDPDTPGL